MNNMLRVIREWTGLARKKPGDPDVHLAAAAEWLCRAQDATSDDGVSASYNIKRRKWDSSYPETTGYIITTMYDYADYSGNENYASRAERMAQWESDIQHESGGVLAGTIGAEKKVPTIFNTGQVLFGWARAYEETGNEIYANSLRKASNWLVEVQDEDGAWRNYSSPFASHSVNTYNTRVAYGLARAWEALGEAAWLQAAIKNVEWAIGNALENAWLPDNCLTDNSRPLTHTIAYAIRGIFEVGVCAENDEFIKFAMCAAEHVMSSQRSDGALPGRLDSQWRPSASWSCLTGNSQMALNWLRMDEITGSNRFRRAAKLANKFNMSIQQLDSSVASERGGIQGSYPVYGEYMKWRMPNWAAKFFMDAIMLEQGYPVDRVKSKRMR